MPVKKSAKKKSPGKPPRDTRARYPIRAVSKLTGIGIDTLRAWERRHAAVTPIRDDRGRLYTDADIDRLRLLQRALAHGHSIGRLASLTNEELHPLAGEPAASRAPSADQSRSTTVDAAALAAALQSYDASAIDREMTRLAAVLRPLELLQRRTDAHAGACRRRVAPPSREHRAGAPDVLHHAEPPRFVPARVRAPDRAGEAGLRDARGRSPRDRHAWRRAAGRQQRFGRHLSRARSSRARPCRQRDASRRAGAGAGAHQGCRLRMRQRGNCARSFAICRPMSSCGLADAAPGATPRSSLRAGRIFGDYTAYQQELVRLGGHIA